MDEFARAEAKHAKNKKRMDAYVQSLDDAKREQKELLKSSVKRCFITITICDGSNEITQTWDANQLLGTVIPGQRRKEWYLQTVKDLLEKPFGRLSCQ
jgi:hypothetical protein